MPTLCKCSKPARPGQRNCWDCHAAAMRNFRARTILNPTQRLKMNCRAYTHVYIKRGKLIRGPCTACGTISTPEFPSEPHHEDYTKPLAILWFCKPCHLELHGKIQRKL